MSFSSPAHSEAFVRAIDAIYQCAAEPTHWPMALQTVADCFEDVGAILIYGKDDGSFGAFGSASLLPVVEEWGRDWTTRDTRAARVRERGYFLKRDVITSRDLFTSAEMDADPFHADLLARHGLRDFIGVMVSPDPRIEVGVSIQRRIGKHGYVESDFDVLSRLGVHIERSLRLGIRLMDAELSKMGLGNALARVGIGVFVLDSLGRIVFSNPASESLLGDGLAVVDNRLIVTPTASNAQAFDTLKRLSDVNQGDLAEQRPIRIHRRSSGRPLTLYVIPIPMAATAVNQFLTHARVIVLVIDPDDDSPPEPSLVRDILGLTLGEARVAALVGVGLSTGQAAQQLGIADETARSVLKRVFAKVGVSRQSELAAMMTRLILK